MNVDSYENHLFTEVLSPNGSDIPVFLLHGWGHTSESMRPLAQLIPNQYPKHLIDLPGFGKSSIPPTVWNSFDYADKLRRYMDECKIEKAHFIGHSFGGKVAFSFASRYPDRLGKLVLMGSSGLKRKKTFRENARFKAIIFSGKILKKLDQLFGLNFFNTYFAPRFGSKDYQSAGAMKPILIRSVNEDLTDDIVNVKVNTLLIWGEKDQETPIECGQRFNQLISQSKLISFSQHGHYLFLDAGAHLCAAHIIPFLKEDK